MILPQLLIKQDDDQKAIKGWLDRLNEGFELVHIEGEGEAREPRHWNTEPSNTWLRILDREDWDAMEIADRMQHILHCTALYVRPRDNHEPPTDVEKEIQKFASITGPVEAIGTWDDSPPLILLSFSRLRSTTRGSSRAKAGQNDARARYQGIEERSKRQDLVFARRRNPGYYRDYRLYLVRCRYRSDKRARRSGEGTIHSQISKVVPPQCSWLSFRWSHGYGGRAYGHRDGYRKQALDLQSPRHCL